MPRLLAMPLPEPAQQASRILAVQRNIVLPVRVILMGVVFYYLFYLRWINQPATPREAVVLEMLQRYFIFYIIFIALAGVLLVLRRFPATLVQWVVFVVGLLDGLLLAGLTVETSGFGSNLFWVFPGLIIVNALSIPLATPQIVLNLSLSVFYIGAGLLYAGIKDDPMLPPFPEKIGSSTFTVDDLKDVPSFSVKLNRHGDPLSQFLWERLSAGVHNELVTAAVTNVEDKVFVATLVEELNRIIRAGPVYSESRFAGVALSAETQSQLGSSASAARLTRLNRLLLEDAYPEEIARKRRPRPRELKFMGSTGNRPDLAPVETEAGSEPFMLRLIILWLLTASCYGVQLLAFRDRQAAEESQEAAARNSELKAAGRLAAEIAHQLKNPLGIINNCLFSLQKGLRDGKQDVSQQIEIIREEIDRSDRIITQLMGYAQLSEGRVEKLSVAEELNRALTEVFPPAANYSTRIHRDFGPNLPTLMMQRSHLSAAFVNLLQNAREALQGRGNIHVSAHGQRDNTIEVIVADDGAGISAEKLGRIFEPYFTSKDRGTGLGLAIVKHNVELYGGTVSVESKPGKGARFILLFPARTFVK